jgi:hypothetical protein
LHAVFQQYRGKLPAGFAGGHDIVDDQWIAAVGCGGELECAAQVPTPRYSVEPRLRSRGTYAPYAGDERQTGRPSQWPAQFARLIESPLGVTQAMQGHRAQSINSGKPALQQWQEKLGKCRRIIKSVIEFERFQGAVNGKRIM